MKNVIPFFAMLFFAACAHETTMQDRVHQYMKDSVVATFNDPASYQFVSMELDTVTVKELSNRIKQADGSGLTFDTQRALIKQHENTPDKILYIDVDVDCRGKNKFGALILNKVKLRYDPDTKSFVIR